MAFTAKSCRGAVRAAAPMPPAALALAEAMKKPGRFPVASKEARTVDGRVFDSAAEARRYCNLRNLERAGEICGLEPQFVMGVSINGEHFCRFTVDFKYYDRRLGREIYEETNTSGTVEDAAYRLRRKAAELFHGVKITEFVS